MMVVEEKKGFLKETTSLADSMTLRKDKVFFIDLFNCSNQ